jgi:hypothetical protein
VAKVTEAELDSIREAQLDFMPDLSIIRRRSYVGDDEFATGNVALDVPCRVTPGYGTWRLVADRFQGITPFTLTFPYGTDIKAGDQVVDDEARTFEVRDVKSPNSYDTAIQVLADLVTDG